MKFSKIEHRILEMIIGNMTDKEIAFALDLSEEILAKHVETICRKLNVSDRESVTTFVIKKDLLKIDL